MTRHCQKQPDHPMILHALAVERQLAKLRGGIGRLIDSYAEELIDRAEFEPRLSELRRRVTKLEAEAATLQRASAQIRSLQLVIGKVETFASLIEGRLETADWATKRALIRTLVRRIEIDDDHVRVVFRVDPAPCDSGGPRRLLQHCPERDRAVAFGDDWRALGGCRPASDTVSREPRAKDKQPVSGARRDGLTVGRR